jgi:hypothetical protein
MFQQIIIVVSVIIGLFILYYVGRSVIASVSPEIDERIELHFILKDIKRYFGFLFEKGYKIREAHYFAHPNGSWQVDIESKECVVSIVQDRSEILAYFSPSFGSIPSNDKVSIEALIYFLSEGKNIVKSYKGNLVWGKRKQFERLAGLLRTYIDQIAPHFKNTYYEYKDKLKEAERQYFNIRVTEIVRQKTE